MFTDFRVNIQKQKACIGLFFVIQTEYGRDCRDISCAPGQKCIISREPCSGSNKLENTQCGKYPTCVMHNHYSSTSGSYFIPIQERVSSS